MSDDSSTLRQIFQTCHTIAVVGLSADPTRPSFAVAQYLQAQRFRIVPVNPRYREILRQTCYASLAEIPFRVDLVDVFRQSAELVPIAQSAIQIGAKGLWQQLGLCNLEADALARAAGLLSVMNRCVKIEHARQFSDAKFPISKESI